MPTKNPHAYATRSAADIQEQNPKNSSVKGKSGNKKMITGKGNVKESPVGKRFGKLAKLRESKPKYT